MARPAWTRFILPLLAVLLIIIVLAGVYGMIVWKWSYSEANAQASCRNSRKGLGLQDVGES